METISAGVGLMVDLWWIDGGKLGCSSPDELKHIFSEGELVTRTNWEAGIGGSEHCRETQDIDMFSYFFSNRFQLCL